ncbi:MAG TPA: transglutaminase family protein, partial [Flavisolibacter sp.]
GTEINYQEVNEFFIHKVLEAKRGNQLTCGIIYVLLCELLDIPVKAIGIPKQFVLAYFKPGYEEEESRDFASRIEFYIDPSSGMVFTHKDIESYFRRISVPPVDTYFKPLSNKKIIRHLLEETALCFDTEKETYKKEELMKLAELID